MKTKNNRRRLMLDNERQNMNHVKTAARETILLIDLLELLYLSAVSLFIIFVQMEGNAGRQAGMGHGGRCT